MSRLSGQLIVGQVMHRRFFPVQYRFVYRVFTLLLDLDRLDDIARRGRLFAHTRFTLVSFHDRDHGAGDGTPPRDWLQSRLAARGLDLLLQRIEMQCFPRVLGHVFNPLSVWFCFGPEDALVAVLCEVHNTFGERHSYLLHRDGEPMEWPVRHAHVKGFHVSPFIGMEADCRFRFARAGEESSTVIHEYQEGRLMLVAVQRGEARALTDGNLLRVALAYPLLTLKVVLMIHWQALKIWLRGAAYFPKPPPPREEIS